jgi:serine/threonine protein kinase
MPTGRARTVTSGTGGETRWAYDQGMSLPSRIGPYRPVDVLGAGGMGVVYLAQHPDGRMLAVKMVNPGLLHLTGRDQLLARMRREAEIMQRVRSPRVAELVDLDLDGDQPFLATRLVEGRSLQHVVDEQGPLPEVHALALGLAEALAAIHAVDCVHRDLKPSNVMLVAGEPVVIDFGIAHMVDATRLTQGPIRAGTLGYMAPEALEGAVCGPPADLFAWAGTVAFAATGRPVFGRGPLPAVLRRVLEGSADLDGIHAGLVPLLRRALAADPAARPTAAELLDQLTGRATASLPPSLPPVQPGRDAVLDLPMPDDYEPQFIDIRMPVGCPDCKARGTLSATDLCTTCDGTGRVDGMSTIRMKVSRDMRPGQIVRLAKQGEAGIRGGAPGDVYVRLVNAPNSRRD